MKKVFALCAIVLMLAVGIVPAFAETWAEESPEYDNPLVCAPSFMVHEVNTRKVIEIVEKAYELGLFGGAHPVHINYYFDSSNEQCYIKVVTPCGSNYGAYYAIGTKQSAFDWYQPSGASTGTGWFMGTVATSGQTKSPYLQWVLHPNGDWVVSNYYSSSTSFNYSTVALGSQTTAVYKSIAYYSRSTGEWRKPYVDNSVTGWGLGTTEQPGLQAIIAKYDEQIAKLEYVAPEPAPPNMSYQLDIAAIFDGYFAGVRDTLGAFDINLFGINVIGVLVAFLVIAIVAFIVRKLWK